MDEDESWFETLAGRGAPDDEAAAREARLLRARIQAQQLPAPAAPIAPVDAAREAALIARARAAGVLPQSAPRQRRAPRWFLAAAALAAVALLLGVWRMAAPPEAIVRGMSGGTVRLESAEPRRLQQALLQELNAAGAHAQAYQRLGRFGVDADLPQPLTPQVRALLERRHIPAPADGALIIEITAPGSP
jgi:hypothetical protein